MATEPLDAARHRTLATMYAHRAAEETNRKWADAYTAISRAHAALSALMLTTETEGDETDGQD